ncbi:hypothetical protein A5791_20435 [Mycobacterium sp. 852002-51163_SCH5372311]|uniref:serine/threonine-protein kinase n=1 Tax=Mycobacterium sp. 852002-51163_SCH5372311 TaxID=1834097 RepID=UPI0008015FFE|nr:hypothetical protein A5791_20435 [Mycobacterium sp. 852002-51163_SCH5372311]
MPLPDGATFAGFGIVRLLSAGGMGEVYLAQHPRLPRLQALRILAAEPSADDEFRARFQREADAAAALSHPHILGVHDRGECDGRLWISTGYVDGTDAATLLRERYPHGMPRIYALEIVDGIAKALDYAHEHGLLHRNVKPANILMSSPGTAHQRILLADLGIARRITDISGLTAANLGYTAPEQLLDLPVDARADQYSLAATAYHLLTGTAPFEHPSPAVVISRQLDSAPPRLARPELAGLDAALSRALARDPANRFTTCQDFAVALRADEQTRAEYRPAAALPAPAPIRAAAPPPGPPPMPVPVPYGPPWPVAGPPPGWGPPPRRRRRRGWALAGAALVLVTVATVTAALILNRTHSSGHAVTATTTVPAGVWASDNDTGPVTLINDEPTCPRWTPIGQALVNSPIERWAVTHPGQPNPLTHPGDTWTPDERKAMQDAAHAYRVAAVKTAALARTTPHRVVREFYEQFIAYAHAFADVLGDNYVPTNAAGATAESAYNALISLCSTVDTGAARARSTLVTAPAAPKQTARPQDPMNPKRFATTSDLSICGELISVFKTFKANPTVLDWAKGDHNPLTPEQRAANDAVAPLMLNLADDTERIAQRSDNPLIQDFAVFTAQYQRGFAKALPTYTSRDGELAGAAGYTREMLVDACMSAGT